MRFEAAVALDRAEYREFIEVQFRRRVRILLPILAFLLLLLAFLFSLPSGLSVLSALVAVVCLDVYWRCPALLAARGWKTQSRITEQGITVYRFAEDHFATEHPMATSQIRYTAVKRLVETETLLLLYYSRRQAWAVPKSSLTVGTVEEFREFIAQKTVHRWERVTTVKAHRRRATVTGITLALAFAVIFAVEGAQYIRRPVTVTAGEASCTLSLPYFLEELPSFGEEQRYAGKDITVAAEYTTHAQLQWRLDNAQYEKPLSLENYAAFEQTQETVPAKGEWVADDGVSDELYMPYADGAEYVCVALHWTVDGCWRLEFRCPGERQDTYYNRFSVWRTEASYSE